MKEIVEKSIKGGYFAKLQSEMVLYEIELPTARESIKYIELKEKYLNQNAVLDPIFWQSLGKACAWDKQMYTEHQNATPGFWYLDKALRFHEINLTKGFSYAIDWLTELILL